MYWQDQARSQKNIRGGGIKEGDGVGGVFFSNFFKEYFNRGHPFNFLVLAFLEEGNSPLFPRLQAWVWAHLSQSPPPRIRRRWCRDRTAPPPAIPAWRRLLGPCSSTTRSGSDPPGSTWNPRTNAIRPPRPGNTWRSGENQLRVWCVADGGKHL